MTQTQIGKNNTKNNGDKINVINMTSQNLKTNPFQLTPELLKMVSSLEFWNESMTLIYKLFRQISSLSFLEHFFSWCIFQDIIFFLFWIILDMMIKYSCRQRLSSRHSDKKEKCFYHSISKSKKALAVMEILVWIICDKIMAIQLKEFSQKHYLVTSSNT